VQWTSERSLRFRRAARKDEKPSHRRSVLPANFLLANAPRARKLRVAVAGSDLATGSSALAENDSYFCLAAARRLAFAGIDDAGRPQVASSLYRSAEVALVQRRVYRILIVAGGTLAPIATRATPGSADSDYLALASVGELRVKRCVAPSSRRLLDDGSALRSSRPNQRDGGPDSTSSVCRTSGTL
jgi:hypothetical protein